MSIHECCASYADALFSDEMEAEGKLGHRCVRPLDNDAPLKIDGFKRDWGTAQGRWVFSDSSVGGSVEAKGDTEKGTAEVSGEGHVSVKNDEGTKVTVQGEGSIQRDSEGNVNVSGGVKVSVEKEFRSS